MSTRKKTMKEFAIYYDKHGGNGSNGSLIFWMLVLLLWTALSLQGCKDEALQGELRSEQQVDIFPSKGLKASLGNSWTTGERLGLFMLNAGSTDLTTALEKNKQYVYKSYGREGNFELEAGESIYYYPLTGNVDFVAYAPYQSNTSTSYAVNVKIQGNPTAIDLLYSNSSKGLHKGSGLVNLTMDHQLSKVRFTLQAGIGMSISDLATATIKIKGMPTQVSFDLETGSFGQASDIADIGLATAREAILIPQSDGTGKSFVFSVGGKEYTYSLASSEDFAKGKLYEYSVTINDKSITAKRLEIVSWQEDTNLAGTSLSSKFVYIPPGTFQMGAVPQDANAESNEKPRHWVKLTKGFYMSKYEVTTGEYVEFLNAINCIPPVETTASVKHPVTGKALFLLKTASIYPIYENNKWKAPLNSENFPMGWVTCYGAMEYAKWAGGTLPTEAQWEYAYRAGTTTIFPFGDNVSLLNNYEWTNINGINEIGQKLPNPWGLYDMGGNVDEWTSDVYMLYSTADLQENAIVDPSYSSSSGSDQMVLRGFGRMLDPNIVRASLRGSAKYEIVFSNSFGFRIIIEE